MNKLIKYIVLIISISVILTLIISISPWSSVLYYFVWGIIMRDTNKSMGI